MSIRRPTDVSAGPCQPRLIARSAAEYHPPRRTGQHERPGDRARKDQSAMSATTETAGLSRRGVSQVIRYGDDGQMAAGRAAKPGPMAGPSHFHLPVLAAPPPYGFAVPAVRAVTPGGVQTGEADRGTGAY